MSDERYNNTGRWRSNWQKIRNPQQKAEAFPVNEPGKILYGAMPDLVNSMTLLPSPLIPRIQEANHILMSTVLCEPSEQLLL